MRHLSLNDCIWCYYYIVLNFPGRDLKFEQMQI